MVLFSRNLLLFSLLGVCNLANVASTELCGKCSSFVEKDVDIVVIGAGMAGLTAAYTIENSSTKSYVLLEAKDKVGGKIQAAYAADTGLGITIEEGANWIGGFSPNPMFDLAVEYGLRVFQQNFLDVRSFTEKGKRIKKRRINRALNKFDNLAYDCLDEAGQKIYEDFLDGIVAPDISVQEQLVECGWVSKGAIDEWVSWYNVDYGSHASPESTAISSYPDYTYEDFLGPKKNEYNEFLVVDERGFQHIPTKFAEKLLNAPVKNTEVCRVQHTGTAAKVETSTCTRYNAKKVISTFSPSIYRYRPELFSPELDMTRNPFFDGHYQKVFYKFPKVFWNDKVEFINIVLPVDHRGECGWFQNLDHKRENKTSNKVNSKKFPGIVDDKLWPGSHVLFCLIATDAVENLGGIITESIAMTFLEPLKKIWPNRYEDPEAVYIPNWEADPYTYGPIYWKAGFGSADFEHFISQGEPTVHVSGGHTCQRYGGWTHGAYYAGIRSANIVLAQLGVPDIDTTENICDIA